MYKTTMRKSLKVLFCLSLLILMCSFASALAWRGGGGGGHGGGGGFHGGGGYHGHYGGGYHGWGWYGYPTVVVEDPYSYYYGYGASYPIYEGDYVAVAPAPATVVATTAAPAAQPVAQASPAVQPKSVIDTTVQFKGKQDAIGDSVTLYIPNSKGRFTAVTLIKRANGYSGPQGEFYPNNPTIAQLKAVYGN